MSSMNFEGSHDFVTTFPLIMLLRTISISIISIPCLSQIEGELRLNHVLNSPETIFDTVKEWGNILSHYFIHATL